MPRGVVKGTRRGSYKVFMTEHYHCANPKGRNTEIRIEQLKGKEELLKEWEAMPEDVQIREHDYIMELRQSIRQIRNYILHRRDPAADMIRIALNGSQDSND